MDKALNYMALARKAGRIELVKNRLVLPPGHSMPAWQPVSPVTRSTSSLLLRQKRSQSNIFCHCMQ